LAGLRTVKEPLLSLPCRAGVGLLRAGSDIAWSWAGYVGWSPSESFELQAGYLWIGADYDDDEFLASIRYHGPFLVAAFKFLLPRRLS
jgi:hypothetical protein